MGYTMPMKIVPISAAIMKSITGSARDTASLSSRSRSPSVTLATRINSVSVHNRNKSNHGYHSPTADP